MKDIPLNLLLDCDTRAHCRICREDSPEAREWRLSVVGVAEYDCPHGITAEKLPSRGLGDTIEKATSTLGIRSCGGCKRRRDWLNRVVPYQKA